MTSETTSTIIGFMIFVLGFAILWQTMQHNRQCKNNIEMCSSFDQCSYYHFNYDFKIPSENFEHCAKLLQRRL